MKFIVLTLLLIIISRSTLADTLLYRDDIAGLEIVKSKEISSLEQDGNNFSFTLNSERFFTLTGFLLKQASSSRYPNAEGINEAFSNVQSTKNEKYSILEKGDIYIGFGNRKIMGSLYVSNYSGSTRMLCDMNFIHPIGDKYYWIMTLTTASEECADQRESLMKSLRNVYQSISVGKI
jgi:hypothetical protein